MKEESAILSLLKNKDSGRKMNKQVFLARKGDLIAHPLDKSITFNPKR